MKDSPPLEFEGACAQRKVMSVPEDDEDAASEHDWDASFAERELKISFNGIVINSLCYHMDFANSNFQLGHKIRNSGE